MESFKKIELSEGKKSTHYYINDERCLYSCSSTRGETKYLRCIERECSCRAKIENETFKRTNNEEHIHNNHQDRAAYEIAFEKLRNEVKIDRNSIKKLHSKALKNLNLVASGMFAWEHCRRTLQKIRHNQMPKCQNLSQLEHFLEDDNSIVHKIFGKIRDTEFYQGAVNGNIIFANMELIEQLPENVELYVDATFKVSPFLSRQLLIILAELQNRPRPILYAIMNGQSTNDYQCIFEAFRDGILSHDGILREPKILTSDFEQSMRLAVHNVWPTCQRVGCNFHFCQAIRRKARSLQTLSTKIDSSKIHHHIVKMFMRLSLLPTARIVVGFDSLINFIHLQKLFGDFEEFLDYFKKTWLGRFPLEEWGVSERDRRTNNNVESYNRTIKLVIPMNPTPWVFLDSLLDLAYQASASFASDRHNNVPRPPDNSYISEPLEIALSMLNEGKIDELEFLKKMAST